MGKNKNLSNFVKIFIVLFVIILFIGIVQLAKPGQGRNTAAMSGTATLILTPISTPTATATDLSPTQPPETENATKPPPSPTATTTPTASNPEQSTTTPLYTYEVIKSYPHDPMAFTQGLIVIDGIMYEGTGRYQQSTLRQVDLSTGNSLQRTRLPDELFGEGITLFDDRIIQLTWKAGIGFVYSKDTFELLQTFTYPTEGWGITHDGERLI
ncbi:MAG: glutaminyl-peptide cyclotransferase, partial [Anaerolineae bacterium]|nr:glutaminyl-peptide cyclotransferase [Anaerolineae bacterium]